MSDCECYKIGGPWIAEDPNCPIHGVEAQAEEERRESELRDIRDRIAALEAERDALRADAERYRMWRHMAMYRAAEIARVLSFHGKIEEIDAVIDAAIAAKEKA